MADLLERVLSTLRSSLDDAEAPALAAELWADIVADRLFERDQLPRQMYAELAGALRASRAPEAPIALAALAVALPGRAAEALRRAQEEAVAERGADDATDLGIGRATPTVARVASDARGDAVALVVGFDQPGGAHSVTVVVDQNLGGVAADLALGPPPDTLVPDADEDLAELDLADARAWADSALDEVRRGGGELAPDAERVSHLVARRLALLPGGGAVPARPTLTEDELDDLVAAFLASPEAAALDEATLDQATWIVELWVDHAVHGTIGGPLRVSELLVVLFCLEGFNATAASDDPATVAAAPAVLDAWIRHAARTTGLPDRWRDEALAALAQGTPYLGHPELVDEDAEVMGDFDDLAPLPTPEPGDWTPLAPAAERPPGWGMDLAAVDPSLDTRVQGVAAHAAVLANALLGAEHVQRTADAVVAAARGDDPPLAEHRAPERWARAAVWLVAEDLDAFGPGRDPGDLALALGSDPETLASLAARIRAAG